MFGFERLIMYMGVWGWGWRWGLDMASQVHMYILGNRLDHVSHPQKKTYLTYLQQVLKKKNKKESHQPVPNFYLCMAFIVFIFIHSFFISISSFSVSAFHYLLLKAHTK